MILLGGGWCDRLKQYYFASKKDVIVYNLGVSGATSVDILQRFEIEYKARHPEVVIIAIGMNDSLFDQTIQNNWVTTDKTKGNLEKIINIVRKDNGKIVFIGLTSIMESLLNPTPWATQLSYSTKSVIKYNQIIKKVATENDVPFCPMFDLLKEEDLDDGLHSNAQGHKKMFKRIKNFLEKEKVLG
jgi:lysophospholipase L1-like esterase